MRRFFVFLMVALLSFSIFASNGRAEWKWKTDDREVNFFRYQLESTEGEWIVVDSDVTSYVCEDVEGGKAYTLYLQASYDGINWSESASQKIVASFVEEKEEVVEVITPATPIVEEPKAEIMPTATISVEETKAEATSDKAKDELGFTFSLLFKGGTSSPVNIKPLSYDNRLTAGVGFDFANIFTAGNHVGFGLRWDVIGDFYNEFGQKILWENTKNLFTKGDTTFFKPENYSYVLRTSLIPTMNMRFGFFQLDMGVGVGAGMQLTSRTEPISSSFYDRTLKGLPGQYGFYGEALLGARFYMGRVFSLGVEATGRVSIAKDPRFDVATNLIMGFSF